jgi:membrane-associated phospholipid phosphatase
MTVRALGPAVLLAMIVVTGCASTSPPGSWGARWPAASDLRQAAVSAARSPATWVPLAGAAVLCLGDLDEDLSAWGADHAPLFGSDAEAASDDLRSVARGAWLVSALAAPSDGVTGKASGLAVGVATLWLEDAVTGGIKDLAGRQRPDGSDDKSFTSGHAGTASAAATLARRNLEHLDLPGWLDGSLRIGLHGIALGTGWARVEAEKHHVTDVLTGYAVGHFLAAFMQEAFMRSPMPQTEVRYLPLEGGGAVTFTVVLGH